MNSKEDPKDSDDQRDTLLKQWHEYGKTYNVFVPDEQPAPKIWVPELLDIVVRSPQWLRKEF